MRRIKAAFLNQRTEGIGNVYSPEQIRRLAELCELFPVVVTPDNIREHVDKLREVEAVFSTWGMFVPEPALFAKLESLRIVFYAAGSVKDFAGPFLERGVKVCGAWRANAVPVAEFCLAQILLSLKGYFHGSPAGPGVYGETVGLVGCGQIARTLVGFLKHHQVAILVHDPYLTAAEAAALGVENVALDELFTRAMVVSNHLPNLRELERALSSRHFASMRKGATFINTGRGAQVDEGGLADVLARRGDLTALLDVTFPEPPAADSALRRLPNVHLSPHIAGSLNDEKRRMAEYMLEEFVRWRDGEGLHHEITAAMVGKMA